jgi:hypothetical protein
MPPDPAVFTYTFSVQDRDFGSRLADHGLSRNGKRFAPTDPKMKAGDTLQVEVMWPGRPEDAPLQLAGHFMISAAPLAAAQVMPSPFRNGDHYLCYKQQTVAWSNRGDTVTYLFPGLVCADGAAAQYELTFTLECEGPGFYNDRQWSIDPEFDTGN